METEELKENAKDIASHVGDYLNTLYRLAIVTITQKATNIAAGIIASLAVCIIGTFVIFFASAGLAWWLGDLVKNRAMGFFIVAGFYLLLILLIVASRKKIVFPYIRNRIIGKHYE